METLRIKCPSCGAILEVKNSKQESVKKIVCPNCHKRLAVTFGEMPAQKPAPEYQPIGKLYEGTISYPLSEGVNAIPNVSGQQAEIKVIHLADGTCKHILRILSSEQSVLINGQSQQEGDEIVLSPGDDFELDGHLFSFDKPGKTKLPEREDPESTDLRPTRKASNGSWMIMLLFALMCGGALWLIWPDNHIEKPVEVKAADSVIVNQDTIQPEKKTVRQKSKVTSLPTSFGDKEDDDYTLDIQAAKGNIKAQYQLGMRWVTGSDCSQVIKGVRYLEAAARNGSSDAQYALGIVFYKGAPSCGIARNEELSLQYMRQASSNGNAKARRFIESH